MKNQQLVVPDSVGTISEAELTAQALAADPDLPLALDARPFSPDGAPAGLLPEWYMPAPTSRRRSRGRTVVVAVVVGAALVINALGFCITYGQLSAG
jgi:hypothetical protein